MISCALAFWFTDSLSGLQESDVLVVGPDLDVFDERTRDLSMPTLLTTHILPEDRCTWCVWVELLSPVRDIAGVQAGYLHKHG